MRVVNYVSVLRFEVQTPIGNFHSIPTDYLLDVAQKRIDYLRTHPQDAAEAFGYEDSYTEDYETTGTSV